MLRILLIYSSMTGNTERMANQIKQSIKADDEIDLTVIDVFSDKTPNDLQVYDGLLIGSYTWGDGDIPDELLDLYDNLVASNFKDKIVSLFGSGDEGYEHFCGALHKFEEALLKSGALLPLPLLKVDLEPSDIDLNLCSQFGIDFASLFR